MKIAIGNLVVTKQNPRTTGAADTADKALVASLSTHGLIQPLVVRPLAPNGHGVDVDGKYEVIAGSRRLEAAQTLGWTEIECVENDAEYGVSELGAAENMLREAMHPLDECRVISRLVADGESAEDVAARFGQSARWVDQRIKLNDLCSEVQQAFREGEVTMAAAQAFTLGDKAAQKKYLAGARQDWQLEPATIKAHFQNKAIPAKHALFALSEYPQDKILGDLFGEEMWCQDRKAFDQLQRAALTRLEEELVQKEGWGSVVLLTQGSDHKITAKYVKVEGRILKADRAKYACIVTYTPSHGSVAVDKGYALRSEVKKIKPAADATQDTAEPADVEKHTADTLSTNQLQILGALQTSALEDALIAGDVHLALLTLAGPLVATGFSDFPMWCGGRRSHLDYKQVNEMVTGQLEPGDKPDEKYVLPLREQLGDMSVNDLGPLLCALALRSMAMLRRPDRLAQQALDDGKMQWLAFDEGFLKRYRTDALQDLGRRLKLKTDDLSKNELIALIKAEAAKKSSGQLLKLLDLYPKPAEAK